MHWESGMPPPLWHPSIAIVTQTGSKKSKNIRGKGGLSLILPVYSILIFSEQKDCISCSIWVKDFLWSM